MKIRHDFHQTWNWTKEEPKPSELVWFQNINLKEAIFSFFSYERLKLNDCIFLFYHIQKTQYKFWFNPVYHFKNAEKLKMIKTG